MLKLLKRVWKFWTRRFRRFRKWVYVELLKPPRRYVRPSSTPGLAYDIIVSGITLVFGIAYLLV